MTPQAALVELLDRLAAQQGAAVQVGSNELNTWPAEAVAALKSARLLVKARRASSIVCPGCERECAKPVEVFPSEDGRPSQLFIVCNEPEDLGHIPVELSMLEQWQFSGELVAGLLSGLLDLRRPSGGTTAGRWEIGMFKGSKHASHLVLLADGDLKLSLAGHSIALADVLEVKGDRFAVDRRTLVRLVDQPVAGAGDAESAEQRRERLKARVRAEKARGTKAFLKVVALEEGISPSRLKQLVKEEAASAKTWLGLLPQPKGAVSKAIKTKR